MISFGRMTSALGLGPALACFASIASAQIKPQYEEIGPIDVQTRYQRPAAAAYFHVSAGESFQVLVTHEDAAASGYAIYDTKRPLVVLRVYDPDENLIAHRVVDTAVDPSTYPSLAADDLASGILADLELQASNDGVYVVRMSAGDEHSKLHLGVIPGTAHAVAYGNGIWQEWRATPGPLWLWVPAASDGDIEVELRHDKGSFTVWGNADAWSETLTSGTLTRTVASGSGGELWRIDGLSPDWRFRAGGDVPILLATSAALAQELDAGLVTIESGSMAGERVAHRFQKRIAEDVVPALVDGIGDPASLRALAEAAISSPGCTDPADIAVAERAVELVSNEIPTAVWGLDHWRFGAEATTHPWADVEHHQTLAGVLAWLFDESHPCNPWGPSAVDSGDGNSALIYRAALAALVDMMDITEDERIATSGDDWSTYPGSGAFPVGDRTWTYAMVAPRLARALPPPLANDVLSSYSEGMRRIALDRRYCEPFVSARNQSSFYVSALGALALDGTEPSYEIAARAYADRYAHSADPAGWFPESLGPDATYNGMTHHELGLYYLETAWTPGCSDANVREAIRESYRFFNHTVAPEPNGTMLGGFNFSHRTNWWFADEQYGGAKKFARDIPEVAIWTAPQAPPDPSEVQADLDYAIGQFDNRVANTPTSVTTLLHRFQGFMAADTYDFPAAHGDLTWPAESSDTDELFDDELYALRRKSYYAVVYVGNPAPGPFYTDQRIAQILPAAPPAGDCPALYTAHYEDTGLPQPSGHAHPCPGDEREYFVSHPFVGGGVSLFWTPTFGAALLAANWSPVVHHGLVGLAMNPDSGNLERTWERYATVSFVSADQGSLRMTGTLPHHYESVEELDYARSYTFEDDYLDVEVVVTNSTLAEISLDDLWENVPVPVCQTDCDNDKKGRAVGFTEVDGSPLAEGDYTLEAVHVTDDGGHGIAIELASGGPASVRVRPVGMTLPFYSTGLHIGRIELPFASSTLAPGESTTIAYRLRALDTVTSVPPVPVVTDVPQVVCAPEDPVADAGLDGGSGDGAVHDGAAGDAASSDGGIGDGGGAGGAAGKPAGAGAGNDDSGCGCRTPGTQRNADRWIALAVSLLAALASLRLRRNRLVSSR